MCCQSENVVGWNDYWTKFYITSPALEKSELKKWN